MECIHCKSTIGDNLTECPFCGIIFSRYKHAGIPDTKQNGDMQTSSNNSETFLWLDLLIYGRMPGGDTAWVARMVFLLVLTVTGLAIIFSTNSDELFISRFLHLVNLPFHEAGHIIFRPFGSWMTSLGGSLFQCLMPLICCTAFLFKTRDPFAGAVAWGWVGQNFIDIAPYIADGRVMRLPLLGGNNGWDAPYGFHDWNYLLNEAGLLRSAEKIGRISHITGAVIITSAIIWGGVVLYKNRA